MAPPTGGKEPSFAGYAGPTAEVRTLAEVDAVAEIRQSCGNGELDRVLGGGLVEGSVTLIGGDPGIGKSTPVVAGAGRAGGAQPDAVRQR